MVPKYQYWGWIFNYWRIPKSLSELSIGMLSYVKQFYKFECRQFSASLNPGKHQNIIQFMIIIKKLCQITNVKK